MVLLVGLDHYHQFLMGLELFVLVGPLFLCLVVLPRSLTMMGVRTQPLAVWYSLRILLVVTMVRLTVPGRLSDLVGILLRPASWHRRQLDCFRLPPVWLLPLSCLPSVWLPLPLYRLKFGLVVGE